MSYKFLGHDINYWLEVKARIESLEDSIQVKRLLQEIAELRSKNNFYESRIKEMVEFMNLKDNN